MKIIRRYKGFIIDFFYSVIAYALPTIILQFVVQPLIAAELDANANGQFISLFNTVKLGTGIFILPLANLRLLRKNYCNQESNRFFNTLFWVSIIASCVISGVFCIFYSNGTFEIKSIARLLTFVVLIGYHDYYSVAFRISINYKKIVIDNLVIVFGYGIGIFLFMHTGFWEIIFIFGYLLGSVYVMLNAKLWRDFPGKCNDSQIIKQYSALGTAAVLSNTSVYCDRMIIYPVLGGYAVSVYNAAAVVSKAISVLSAPLRNVLLSYIVNVDCIELRRNSIKRYLPIVLMALIVIFIAFWKISIIACDILYPQYVDDGRVYIPVIIIAVIFDSFAGVMNIALLRFADTRIQTILSGLKLGVYLLFALILAMFMKLGLWGFCVSILISSLFYLIAVIICLRHNMKIID